MSKPSTITLSQKEQKKVLTAFKLGAGARTIASKLELPRYQVMAFLEKSKLATYSPGTYQ